MFRYEMLVVASPQSVTCINVIGTPVAAAQVCDIASTTIIVKTLSSTGQVRARTVFAFPGGLFEASLGESHVQTVRVSDSKTSFRSSSQTHCRSGLVPWMPCPAWCSPTTMMHASLESAEALVHTPGFRILLGVWCNRYHGS